MKLLLTSNGLANDSIKDVLEKLVGKPRKEIKLAFIPTAAFSKDEDTHETKDWLADDLYNAKEFCGHFTIVSLADEPVNMMNDLEYADVILVGGGNAFYLSYWMEKTGLFEALPKLLESRVYVGISAGTMFATKSLGSVSHALRKLIKDEIIDLDKLGPKDKSSGKTLDLVPFMIRPHYKNGEARAYITDELLEKVSKEYKSPLYALDDQSALKYENEQVEIISEGTWKLFE